MALFGFGKKKEEEKTSACACSVPVEEKATPSCCCSTEANATASCCGSAGEAKKTQNTPCCEGADKSICCIKVLGSNCKSCHTLLENATAAVKALGLGIEVEYVTDLQKVMAYGVMSMPGLVINDQVVSMGKVLKPADVEKLLKKFGA